MQAEIINLEMWRLLHKPDCENVVKQCECCSLTFKIINNTEIVCEMCGKLEGVLWK